MLPTVLVCSGPHPLRWDSLHLAWVRVSQKGSRRGHSCVDSGTRPAVLTNGSGDIWADGSMVYTGRSPERHLCAPSVRSASVRAGELHPSYCSVLSLRKGVL